MTSSSISQDHLNSLRQTATAEINCNLEMAGKFLAFLADDESLTFQTFDDSNRRDKRLARILHGTLEDHAETLIQLNQQGAGVFVTINQTDGKGREASNITRIRAVFVDLDGSPLQPVMEAPIAPHLIVESSFKRYHAYWLLDDLPLDHFKIVQESLAKRFNSDPVVKDLPRVMRLPGFIHQKDKPFQTKILENTGGLPKKSAEFMAAFGISFDRSAPKEDPFSDSANPKPILNAIKSAGIFIRKDGTAFDRWHIKCPWRHLSHFKN